MRRVLLICLSVLVGCSVSPLPRPDAASGAISGLIRYPSEGAPVMRICALPNAGTPTCIRTVAGQRDYRIGPLAGGEYRVVAWLTHSDLRVAGHVHQVQCIRAPCPEMLKSVELPAGARLEGIDINGFYAAREDFPPIP